MDQLLFIFFILVFIVNVFMPFRRANKRKRMELDPKYSVPVKNTQARASAMPAMPKEASVMPTVPRESSAMPHKHRESGVYDSYNRHKRDNSDGAMPHSHNEVRMKHYDSSKLPPGYILLNGEPVRVKDLENR